MTIKPLIVTDLKPLLAIRTKDKLLDFQFIHSFMQQNFAETTTETANWHLRLSDTKNPITGYGRVLVMERVWGEKEKLELTSAFAQWYQNFQNSPYEKHQSNFAFLYNFTLESDLNLVASIVIQA